MSQTKKGPLLRRARFGASGNSDKTLEKLYSQGFVTSELTMRRANLTMGRANLTMGQMNSTK